MQSCGLCLVLDGILATNGCRTNQINVHDYDIFLPFHVCFFYCILCIGSRSINFFCKHFQRIRKIKQNCFNLCINIE